MTKVTSYRPQTKFAKIMFSQVFVCPREGCLCPGGSLSRRGLCPGTSLSKRVSVQRGLCLGGLCLGGRSLGSVQGVYIQGVSVREIPIWQCAGSTHPTGMHSSFLLVVTNARQMK